jgi:hypothetical protein
VDPNPKKNEFGSTTLVKVEESDKKWTSADDDDDEAVKDLSNQLVSADEAKELIAMYTTTVVGAATAAASSDEEGKENGGGGRVPSVANLGQPIWGSEKITIPGTGMFGCLSGPVVWLCKFYPDLTVHGPCVKCLRKCVIYIAVSIFFSLKKIIFCHRLLAEIISLEAIFYY